ncbi:unnamed protein product [Mytilus edulis]|uniref:Uncharacterized protein n=1 Tax=Mytilus edulis TaxID=6550 RepID=A0A8S3U5K5_MYTED|nr:unnamed protein product [Mytilus edulis]
MTQLSNDSQTDIDLQTDNDSQHDIDAQKDIDSQIDNDSQTDNDAHTDIDSQTDNDSQTDHDSVAKRRRLDIEADIDCIILHDLLTEETDTVSETLSLTSVDSTHDKIRQIVEKNYKHSVQNTMQNAIVQRKKEKRTEIDSLQKAMEIQVIPALEVN